MLIEEDENVAHKDASIGHWCRTISAQTGQRWRYLKVAQSRFDRFRGGTLAELVEQIEDGSVSPLFSAKSSAAKS